jgi:hypothetical protein
VFLCLFVAGLDSRYGNDVDDVVGLAASRKIIGRFVEPLENRAYGSRSRKAFGQLVGDIACVEIREDEHVRAPGHFRTRSL